MLRSSRRTAIAFAGALLLSIASVATRDHAEARHDQPTTVSLMHDFVLTAYPELRGRRLEFVIDLTGDFDQDWTVPGVGLTLVVRRPERARDARRRSVREEFLAGLFDISVSNRRVTDARFYGEYVHSVKNGELEQLVKSNPRWTEAEVERAVRNAGGNYPPSAGEDLLATANVRRFVPLFGQVTILSTEFKWHQPEHDNPTDMFAPGWFVTVRGEGPARERRCFLL